MVSRSILLQLLLLRLPLQHTKIDLSWSYRKNSQDLWTNSKKSWTWPKKFHLKKKMNRRFTRTADKNKNAKKIQMQLIFHFGCSHAFFTLLEFQALDFNFVGRRMFMCHLSLHYTHYSKSLYFVQKFIFGTFVSQVWIFGMKNQRKSLVRVT